MSDPPGKKSNESASRKSLATDPIALASSGLEFGFVVALMTLGGWWLDDRFGLTPWLTIIGLFVGSVGGMYKLYLRGKRAFRNEKPRDADSNDN